MDMNNSAPGPGPQKSPQGGRPYGSPRRLPAGRQGAGRDFGEAGRPRRSRSFSPRPGGGGPRRRGAPRRFERQVHPPRPEREEGFDTGNGKETPIPPLGDSIRIIPFGGVEEIGRNMTAIEYQDDIIVIDCGFQFREDDTPGVDYILPNTRYLEERREKIRGIFITHGHLDHIGGIPYIIDRLGYPPLFSRRLTTYMIRKRQEEFPHLKPLDIREVEKEETIRAGSLKVRFFAVTHTIPDSMGIIVDTPHGSIVHTGDLKLDHENGIPSAREEEEFKVFEKERVLLLMADSTNVEKPGFSIPESTVYRNIEEVIKNTKGRLIIGTFSSQLERLIKIVEMCERYGRKIIVEGRSMKVNIEIVKQLGMLKSKKDTFIGHEEFSSLPDNKIVVLATGAQGDEFATLMRTAMKTHKYLKIGKNDTILLSSSIIPGNERAVQKLKDNLSRQGARIIHYALMDVHSSGHANRDETVWIHQKIKPRFFMPVHGYHYMLRVHADIAEALGEETVIPDNSAVIEIQDGGQKLVRLKEMAPSGLRLVDGFSIGDIQEVVIRDRKMLAQDGMFVIIATVNPKNGRLRKSPDIISRGFVYLRESQDLLQQTRLVIKKTIEDAARGQQPINFDFVKANVTDATSRFLFEKTNKRPIVIPVLLGV